MWTGISSILQKYGTLKDGYEYKPLSIPSQQQQVAQSLDQLQAGQPQAVATNR